MASNHDSKNINWMDHYQRITGLIDINAFTEDLYRIEARVVPDDSRNRLVLDFIQIEKSIFYIHRYRKYLLISTLNIEFWYSIYCFWTSLKKANEETKKPDFCFFKFCFFKLPRWICHILPRVTYSFKNMRIFPSFCLSKMCMSHDTWKNSLGKKVHICPCDMALIVSWTLSTRVLLVLLCLIRKRVLVITF